MFKESMNIFDMRHNSTRPSKKTLFLVKVKSYKVVVVQSYRLLFEVIKFMLKVHFKRPVSNR